MGGGRDNFMKKEVNSTGKRNDEDLVLNWKNDKKTRFGDKIAKYITNREELMKTDMSKTDFVLGKNNLFIFNFGRTKNYLNNTI
jgi:alkaline phosphatase